MKFNKTHERLLKEYFELMDENGCVSVSEWVTGKGQYSKKKALPPFVTRASRETVEAYKRGERTGFQRTLSAKETTACAIYFAAHPKRNHVLVLDLNALCVFLFSCAHGEQMPTRIQVVWQ